MSNADTFVEKITNRMKNREYSSPLLFTDFSQGIMKDTIYITSFNISKSMQY